MMVRKFVFLCDYCIRELWHETGAKAIMHVRLFDYSQIALLTMHTVTAPRVWHFSAFHICKSFVPGCCTIIF